MGYLRYRRTVKIIPHLLHLHIAKTGVSLSVGRPPFTINFGRRGTMLTTSVPGSGLSYRTQIKNTAGNAARKHSPEVGWGCLVVMLAALIAGFFIFAVIGR
jgi:Protein of unknown function (DUF4236)